MGTVIAAPHPVCKAILLCQNVDADSSGSLDLTGVVNNLFVDESMVAPPIELFCQITDAMGHYEFLAEIHDLTTNQIVARSEPTVFDVADPLMAIDVIVHNPELQFQTMGLHDLVIFANGEEVDRKQFGVAYRKDAEHAVSN